MDPFEKHLNTNAASVLSLNLQNELSFGNKVSICSNPVFTVAGMNFMSKWCQQGSASWERGINPQSKVKIGPVSQEMETQPRLE